MEDKSSRLTLSDILTYKSRARLFHVGRLDYDSEGLLLMTNDGTLANRLSHPRYGVEKNYMVFLNHPLPQNVASMLVSRGVLLEDGWQKFDKVKILRQGSHKCEVMVALHSALLLGGGRYRIGIYCIFNYSCCHIFFPFISTTEPPPLPWREAGW